ncbi:MAG: DUF1540 domain-containing protein [Eubacteriales bacterium]|jgi:hypothetical protein|nr:DUF1540 domain-containing protein [Clostridiales bacterium]
MCTNEYRDKSKQYYFANGGTEEMALFEPTEYFNVNIKDKPPKHIRGIVCDVKNCVYHDGDNFCTANRISIGPSYATSSRDTLCATFRQRTL